MKASREGQRPVHSARGIIKMTAAQHRQRARQLRAYGSPEADELAVQHDVLSQANEARQRRLTPSELETLRRSPGSELSRMTATERLERADLWRAVGSRKAKARALQHELIAALTSARAEPPVRLTPSETEALRQDLRDSLAWLGRRHADEEPHGEI